MSTVPQIVLNNGVSIPQLGFGVWQVPAEQTHAVVSCALETGYRSIDTAAIYGNEEGVGQAIATSGIAREELFITTKLWNADQGYDSTLRAFDTSAAKLGLDVIDLYLIHWPSPKLDKYLDTWRAMEKLYADGRVRAIGVSNFLPGHLDRLVAESQTVPVVNQVELHPYFQNREVAQANARHGVITESWSPLASGGLLADATVGQIAAACGVSPAQVILRWHLHKGYIVIPKSATPARIAQNFDVFSFELTAGQLATLDGLERNGRIGANPADSPFS